MKKIDNESWQEALNENLEYCNELSQRINIIGKALLNIDQRLHDLEKLNE